MVETGGYLSHGAIVAREFALPAVVNLPGILDMLRDTGPGTTSDIALAFDTTCKGVRSHLYVLHDAGLVAHSEARHGARKDYTWYAAWPSTCGNPTRTPRAPSSPVCLW